MKFEDICTKKTFVVNGQEKTTWLKCGTLRTTDEGKRFIELNHLPNISFFVFEQKKKEENET
uniref:Uncharacterized protein n=1 Tax=viral metagenome TaxID=1070528 RepID=A0A6H1ZBK0_9ZZZZ